MLEHGMVDPGMVDPRAADPTLAARSRGPRASRAPLHPASRSARTVFAHPVLSTPPSLLPVEWVAATSAVPAAAVPQVRGARLGLESQRRSGASPLVPLMVTLTLMLAAALVAPEHPADQEAICQRHNGVAACRVW